jgi:hypothetical protein
MVTLDLDLDLDPPDGRLYGRGVAVLELQRASSLGPTLGVNARGPLMHFTSVDGEPKAVVRLNESMTGAPNVKLAHLRYEDPLAKGARVTVDFSWESEGHDPQFAVTESVAIASWTEGWYPAPLPEPDQSLSGLISAPGKTRLRLPAGWSSVSNGKFVGASKVQDRTVEEWQVPADIARSFSAGAYHSAAFPVGDREVVVHLLSKPPEQAQAQAQAVAHALQAQEAQFGPYPYSSYRIAEVPEGVGEFYASSEMGFIMAKTSAFEVANGNLVLFTHEMAHGWWGNLVPSSGKANILCNEALAQYSAVMAVEAVEGPAAATEFLCFSRDGYSGLQCAAGYFQMAREGHDKPLCELTSGGFDHNLADAKGHWVYHMLRGRVGDKVFFDTLRGLIRDGARRGITLDVVRQSFVRAAPAELDLERFFREWLERAGAPVIEIDWNAALEPPGQASSERIEVVVRQVQDGEPYHLPLELSIDTVADPCRRIVELSKREETFVLETPARATCVRLDPDRRLLLWRPEYGPRPKADPNPK